MHTATRLIGCARGSSHRLRTFATRATQSFDSAVDLDALYRHTPLIRPTRFRKANKDVDFLLKLDSLQPSCSFKDRGMAKLISYYHAQSSPLLICSSGGNAGLAAATIAQKLKMPIEVYVPTSTKSFMIDRIKSTGAQVHIGGMNWNEADARARVRLNAVENAAYIPPFDHPLIWEGNSTVVDELVEANIKPDTIILSVGGGGLLTGVQTGLIRHGLNDVRILAVETEGAASFATAMAAGKILKLDKITSIATSLGALSVAETCLEMSKQIHTVPTIVTDADCVAAMTRFLDDVRILVEPAAGASLSLAYEPRFQHLFQPGERVVIIVCGGSAVTVQQLLLWQKELGVSVDVC